ncbi:Serine/threonine-protein kinase Chk2 [Geodia barretti]|uniref:Serine/threonine-protein kinase Chk2 n=1 Tax=Geodia barretti TaxID=519541 RepID=A0AA35WEK1_GEOBA|nr:Serine/threonine-protein kinase Chk2 [Geodia barretti]
MSEAQTLELNSMQLPSEEEEEEETNGEPGNDVWGRLFPVAKGFVQQDLVKDEYVFGRGEDCDYSFEQSGGKANTHFLAFSKIHFRLYREIDKLNPKKYVVFVEDRSSNGTFVGGEKIGKNKTRVLNSDDEISLALKTNKVFIFHDRGSSESRTDALPPVCSLSLCGDVSLSLSLLCLHRSSGNTTPSPNYWEEGHVER